MLFFAGFFFGAYVSGWLGDNYGRRLTVAIGGGCCTISSLIAVYSINWYMFAVLRFFIGFFANISYVSCFVFVMEVCGPKVRGPVGLSMQAA